VIRAQALTKRYGTTTAVDHADFTVQAGRVTSLLGPGGAGKSTVIRLVLGLDRPSSGSATVNDRPYRALSAPQREVGALLDGAAVHAGRRAYDHLLWLARSGGLPRHRVHEVIGLAGLAEVVDQPARAFSRALTQRLAVAGALLGDPGILVFDEPLTGLDPEGILWLRGLLRELAGEGRTVLVSSRGMAEAALVAEHLVVIAGGRIRVDMSVKQFVADHAAGHVRVRSPQVRELAPALAGRGWKVEMAADRALQVYGASPAQVGECAWEAGVHLHELTAIRVSLETAFSRFIGESATPPDPDTASGSGTSTTRGRRHRRARISGPDWLTRSSRATELPQPPYPVRAGPPWPPLEPVYSAPTRSRARYPVAGSPPSQTSNPRSSAFAELPREGAI
jgi:ABC-2 type transport system ATP-binding protein